MPVRIHVRAEFVPIVVNIREGEYLQYLVSTRSESIQFSLVDRKTGEVILSDAVPVVVHSPTTYMRLWPVVGDRPQPESSVLFTVHFQWPDEHCNLQVQHRDTTGRWSSAVNVDFTSEAAGEALTYLLQIRAT